MYKWLLKSAALPLGEKLRGTNILGCLRSLEESQWWPPERLRALQEEKLQALLAHAYEHVPYYRRLFRRLGVEPAAIDSLQAFQQLPILTKEEIRRNAAELRAKNLPPKAFLPEQSSGSTGEPLLYFRDKGGESWRFAALFRMWRWAGYEFGDRWAHFTIDEHRQWAQRLSDFLLRCQHACFRESDAKQLEQLALRLQKSRPQFVRSYPAILYLVAGFAMAHGMDLSGPKAVFTTASTLFPHYRQAIEAAFRCPVFDHYGGEGIVVAGQCEHGNYHLNVEGAIIEFIAPDGRQAQPGELGSIVLTDLHNYAMPFIRYNIADVGVPSDLSCPCGRGLVVMASIQGRSGDIVVTPEGRYLTMHVFGGFLRHFPSIERYQVVQKQLDHLTIRLVANERFSRADGDRIRQRISEAAGEGMTVDVELVPRIDPTPSGKYRYVISEIGEKHFQSGLTGG